MGIQNKIWLLFILAIGMITPLEGFAQKIASQKQDISYQEYLFDNLHNEAAVCLDNLLRQTDPGIQTQNQMWLESAVIWAWVDSLSRADEAFRVWQKKSEGTQPLANQQCFRLLYQGLINFSMSDLTQAADSIFLASVDFNCHTLIDSVYLSDIFGLLGTVYKKLQDYSQAARYYDQANDLNRKLSRKRSLANNLTDKIPLAIRQKQSATYIESLITEATDIYTELGDRELLAVVFNERGFWSYSKEEYKDALNYFLQVITIKEGLPKGSQSELDYQWNNVATTYQAMGETDRARIFFNKALSEARKLGKNPAKYYVNIAVTYAQEGNFVSGLKYFQAAMTEIDQSLNPDDITSNPTGETLDPDLALFTAFKATAFYRRYAITMDTSDLQNSRLAMNSALNLMDTLRFLYSFDSKAILSAESRTFYYIARNIGLDLFETTGDSVYLDEVFRYSGRSKSVILNEYLASNQSHDLNSTKVSWLSEEDSLKRVKIRLESDLMRLIKQSPTQSDVSELENELRMTEEAIKKNATIIRRDFPEYYRTLYPSKGIGIQEIVNNLEPDESFLDYSILDDEIIVFCLTREGIHYSRTNFASNLNETIQSYLATFTPMVNTEIIHNFVRLSKSLYDGLIYPLEPYLIGNKLIISTDENLGFLPYESLIRELPATNEPDFRELDYLNRRFAVNYIHSHTQLLYRKSESHSQTFRGIIAFAPFAEKGMIVEGRQLEPLPYSRSEMQQIRKSFPLKYYSGSKAIESQFIRSFEKNSILHVSTHGLLNLANPMETKILFSPEAEEFEFHLSELLDRRIRVPMVVLNACNTGAGTLLPGEGVLSIARGFQFAGVPSLITTLWPVDDRSATSIIDSFYRYLKNGEFRSVALRKAKEDYYLSADATTSAPYYWCGHVLFGDSGTLTRISRLRFFPVMAISLAIMLLLFLGGFLLKGRNKR